jgi:DNA-binding NtrC family response regulator
VQTAHGSIDNVISRDARGRGDFVVKPVAPSACKLSLQRSLGAADEVTHRAATASYLQGHRHAQRGVQNVLRSAENRRPPFRF